MANEWTCRATHLKETASGSWTPNIKVRWIYIHCILVLLVIEWVIDLARTYPDSWPKSARIKKKFRAVDNNVTYTVYIAESSAICIGSTHTHTHKYICLYFSSFEVRKTYVSVHLLVRSIQFHFRRVKVRQSFTDFLYIQTHQLTTACTGKALRDQSRWPLLQCLFTVL